jgi:hypothetical protein
VVKYKKKKDVHTTRNASTSQRPMLHIKESFNRPILRNHHVQEVVMYEVVNGVGEMSEDASRIRDSEDFKTSSGDAIEDDAIATGEQ